MERTESLWDAGVGERRVGSCAHALRGRCRLDRRLLGRGVLRVSLVTAEIIKAGRHQQNRLLTLAIIHRLK